MADIVAVLTANEDVAAGQGLYVGCGNGRNYLPLLDAGLDVLGLDLSPEAIPGGLVFLRVNSTATEVYHAHTVTERNELGGRTVRYEAGAKRGLFVHFYSRAELTEYLSRSFTPIMPLREDFTMRAAPKTGSWAQWETAWRRSADLGR